MRFHLVLITVAVYFIWGCKKPTCEPDIVPFPKAHAGYFNNYIIGNYWVYESNTGNFDSIYVTNNTDNSSIIVDYMPGKNGICGTTVREISSSINAKYLTQNNNNTFIAISSINNNTSYPSRYFAIVDESASVPINIFYSSDSTENIPLKNYVLNSKTFADCIKIDYNNVSYYWKKNIGLVGWSNNMVTFSLLRYFIK